MVQDGFSISLKKLVLKKISVSVSKNLVSEKSLSICLGHFLSKKEVSVSVSKTFGLKNLGIGLENMKFLVSSLSDTSSYFLVMYCVVIGYNYIIIYALYLGDSRFILKMDEGGIQESDINTYHNSF